MKTSTLTVNLGPNDYITILKGTRVRVENPFWDGDKPETEFYYEGILDADICVEVRDSGLVRVEKQV